MSTRLYTVLILIASALMLASAVIALRARPHFQQPGGEAEPRSECGGFRGGLVLDEPDEPEGRAADSRAVQSSVKSGKSLAERDRDKFNVGEMRNEVEDMLRRFRGTPEERQDVIDECESGKALILAIADAAVGDYDSMSPEELQDAREEFEKEYRAQLDYLQSGKLKRMLKTPEEQEVIGTTIDVVQQFLERLDDALHAAGY